jgi:uncharacterized protein (TIGR00299 family) protein
VNYLYFDAFAGCSGDMILGSLLDLGMDPEEFRRTMAALDLPVEITVSQTKRAALRGLKVDVEVNREQPVHRKWADIQAIIRKTSLSEAVKNRALLIFRRLFEAEARVHGHPFEKTHLHEAGADDALVDILGFCVLAEGLGVERFYASPLNLGGGWVKASHGLLPVPAPAVSELLKDIPTYSAHVEKELVTPTGAAILSTVVTAFSPFPELCYTKVGGGAGGRDFPDFPNLLRVFLGETDDFEPTRQIFQIETQVDDSSPEVLAGFLEQAIEEGALDVFMTPVVMKKGRLAQKITLLTEHESLESTIRLLLRETSSIGLRYFPVSRRVLSRRFVTVRVLEQKIKLKVADLAGEIVNVQPEFEDCRKAAEATGRPLKEIMNLALAAYSQTQAGPVEDKSHD